MTVEEGKIPAFRERLMGLAERMFGEDNLVPRHHYDVEIPLRELTPGLWDALASLGPFGHGNPEPVFLARGVETVSRDWINGDGLRFVLQSEGAVREAAWFPSRHEKHSPFRQVQKGDIVNLLFTYHRRLHRGRAYHSLSLRDMRRTA